MASFENLNAIGQRKEFVEQSGLVSNVKQLNEQGLLFTIHPDIGTGSIDLHHLKDMTLGRANVCFHHPISVKNHDATHLYGFHIMLKGSTRYSFYHADEQYEVEFKSPEIWLRKGSPKNLVSQSPAEQTQNDLFINFEEELIERLFKYSKGGGACKK